MQKLLILLVLTLSFSSTISAQKRFKVEEDKKSMSEGSYNALIINIPGANEKLVKKEWSKFIGKYKGKTKTNKKANEVFTDNCKIKAISENNIDVYAKAESTGADGVELAVWFNLGVSYLSSNNFSDRYKAAEELLQNFGKKIAFESIKEELKLQKKVLEQKNKDLKKLKKDKEKLQDNILDYKNTIVKMEQNIKDTDKEIEQNGTAQTEQLKEIDTQDNLVKEIEKQLKSLK